MTDRKKKYKKYWCPTCRTVRDFEGRADKGRECLICKTSLEAGS